MDSTSASVPNIILPAERNLSLSNSFSLDIGNTCCKVVCLKPAAPQNPHDQLCFRTFVGTRITTDIIGHIKSETKWNSEAKAPESIYCTGFHIRNTNKLLLQEKFGSNIKILYETDCSVRALAFFLTRVPECEALHNPATGGIQEAMADAAGMIKIQTTLKDTCVPVDDQVDEMTVEAINDRARVQTLDENPFAKRVTNIYPYVLVTCGSACVLSMVKSETDFYLIEGSARSGRTFLAMSKLLLGLTNYEEIMALAAEGDEGNVSTFHRDLKKLIGEEDQDAYVSIPEGIMLFALDKVLDGKSNYGKADLARGLVHMMAEDIAQGAFWAAVGMGTTRVFMTGGLVSHTLMRDAVTKHFLKRCYFMKKAFDLHFPRYGAYLCATGAFLFNKE